MQASLHCTRQLFRRGLVSVLPRAASSRARTACGRRAFAAMSPAAVSPQLLSVAPMMDQTDVYFRQLCRLISRHTWLYTEMVVDKTLIFNPQHDRFLWFPPEQHPIVCQLGGSNPAELAQAAAIVDGYGYDEINLNCGCPSSRVAGKGCFGAALMAEPQLVADACAAMAAVTTIPITVKCRLGVDDVDTYEQLCNFVRTVSEGAPVRHFIIHCRKAILNLDTTKNRSVPPLRRGWAFALKRDFPHLQFTVNGQVDTPEEALQVLGAGAEGGRALGVMIGRAAWKKPWATYGDADRAVFGAPANAAASRRQVLHDYAAWADTQLGRWATRPDGSLVPGVRALTSPLLQMFFGEPGGSKWRNAVDTSLRTAATVSQVLADSLPMLPDAVLDAPPTPVGAPEAPAARALELPPRWAAAAAAEQQEQQSGSHAAATHSGSAAAGASASAAASACNQPSASTGGVSSPTADDADSGSREQQQQQQQQRRQQVGEEAWQAGQQHGTDAAVRRAIAVSS